MVEAVYCLDKANCASADQIVERDARRYSKVKTSRGAGYEIDVLEDGCFAGFALIHRRFGSVLEFHFGPFLPVVFGAAPANGTAPSLPNEGGGSPTRRHRRAERSGGLHETKRSGVEEAWGNPSGGGKARAGRSGRQAKRCPNWRAHKERCKHRDYARGDPVSEPVQSFRYE